MLDILTSAWVLHIPNAGQNIQQTSLDQNYGLSLHKFLEPSVASLQSTAYSRDLHNELAQELKWWNVVLLTNILVFQRCPIMGSTFVHYSNSIWTPDRYSGGKQCEPLNMRPEFRCILHSNSGLVVRYSDIGLFILYFYWPWNVIVIISNNYQ